MPVKMTDAVFVLRVAGGFADVVEQHGQPHDRIRRHLRDAAGGVLVDVVAMIGIVLGKTHHRGDFGDKLGEDFRVGEQHTGDLPAAQQPDQLVPQPFG